MAVIHLHLIYALLTGLLKMRLGSRVFDDWEGPQVLEADEDWPPASDVQAI